MIKQLKMKEDYGYHIQDVLVIEDIVVQEMLMDRYILILEIMVDVKMKIIVVKLYQHQFSMIKQGVEIITFMMEDIIMLNYLQTTQKKILKLLEDYHSDKN